MPDMTGFSPSRGPSRGRLIPVAILVFAAEPGAGDARAYLERIQRRQP